MTDLAQTAPDARRVGLSQLTARIAAELERLARITADVQVALSMCHLELAGPLGPEVIRGLQRIDRVTQELEDLSRLLGGMSDGIPAQSELCAAPLFSTLRLHELGLALDPAKPIHPDVADNDGTVEWL
ncbi:hypothetical protein [Pontitalea aquivivens]|uniref:hypothetical protein n=1 Tax=Pontitalea aquivivens TaxID=3388663 RepID=UPI003970F49C